MARIKLPENVAVAHAMHGGAPHPAAALGALLAKRGYDVTVHELPVIFVSTACPHQLADVPQVKTYINNYDDKPFTLEALVEKLEGRSEFTGVSSTDAFCGLADTRVWPGEVEWNRLNFTTVCRCRHIPARRRHT